VGYINGMMGTEDVPLGGLPEPDMIFVPGAGCVPAMKNFQYRPALSGQGLQADLPSPNRGYRRYISIMLSANKSHHCFPY
jgi:hypothetical protein